MTPIDFRGIIYFTEAFFIIFARRDFLRAAVFLVMTFTFAALSSAFWAEGNSFLASSIFPDLAKSRNFFTASLKVFLIFAFWMARFWEARRYFLADCFMGIKDIYNLLSIFSTELVFWQYNAKMRIVVNVKTNLCE